MVTNVPFYSFKDVQLKTRVPFMVIVLIALGIAVINIDPPIVLFGLFVRLWPVAATCVYVWRKEGPADERDQHLDRRARRAGPAPVRPRRRRGVLHFGTMLHSAHEPISLATTAISPIGLADVYVSHALFTSQRPVMQPAAGRFVLGCWFT